MSDQDPKKSDEEKRKRIYAKGYQGDWAGGRSWAGQDGQHELEERKVKALESIAESLKKIVADWSDDDGCLKTRTAAYVYDTKDY